MAANRARIFKEIEHGSQLRESFDAQSTGKAKLKAALDFIIAKRMYSPFYWRHLYRFIKFKIRYPRVETDGFVFLPRKYQIVVRKGARLHLGRFVWIGHNNALRCHEGELYVGAKTVFGTDNTVNCYVGIHIGDECLFADSVYIVDFDHNYWDPVIPVRSQGIAKAPVRLEGNTWVGTKVTIIRGVTVGYGSVIGAMSLVNRDVPPYAVVGGVPAKVLHYRPRPTNE
jgi:acetyltransferase-like isoleucine patch superfamily enzyme